MWFTLAALFAAGFLGLFTDWLFMGVLFREDYGRYPETWWALPGNSHGKNVNAIILAQALGFVMTIAVFALCNLAGIASAMAGLAIAFVAWLAGPLPVLVINGCFMRIDPKIIFAHATGYLVRMAIAGIAAGLVFSS